MRCLRTLGAAFGCAVLIAGCGQPATETSDSASTAGTTTATTTNAPPVSPDKLNPGRFPTTPLAPLGVAGSPQRGVLLQAQQMADFVTGPWEVDDTLISQYLQGHYVLTKPSDLSEVGPEATSGAAAQHGMVNGFGSARQAADKASMLNAVLRFPDSASAVAAAKDMNDAAMSQPIAGAEPEPVPIPGHPDTSASGYSVTAGSDRPVAAIRAYTAHGTFVLMQFVTNVEGRDAAAAMVAKAIDRQGPLIDEFAPAPIADLAEVEVDPTGLLAKTLPPQTPDVPEGKNAAYGPRGASHFQSNPDASTQLFKDTGVTTIAMAGANVYEARSPDSARMIIGSFDREVTAMEGATIASPIPELPDSHCMAFPKAFYCVAPAGRYAIEITGTSFEDVQQQVAAQYILLTKQ